MSKTITLTIGERLAALRIFDAFKGGITELTSILDDVKKLIVTDEEWAEANKVVTKSEDGKTENWKWDETNEATHKEVELDSNSIGYLQRTIKSKSDNNEIVLTDLPLISLNKKIS